MDEVSEDVAIVIVKVTLKVVFLLNCQPRRLRGLTGSVFDHRSLPREFQSPRGHI